MLAFLILSCEDFLEIETPRNRMVSEEVFSSEDCSKPIFSCKIIIKLS